MDDPGLARTRLARARDLSATVRGTRVLVRRGNRRAALSFAREIDPPWEACLEIADVQARGDSTYLLLVASGTSRAQPAAGQCAGGAETKLLWVALGPRLTPVRRRTILVSSCLENLEARDDVRLRGDSVRVRVDGLDVRTVVRYDRRSPQAGPTVDTLPPRAERPSGSGS